MMISHISACMKSSAALECCVRAPVFFFSVLLCCLIHLIQPKQNNFAWHAQHSSELTSHTWLGFWGAQKPWGKILKAHCFASCLKSSPTHDFFLIIRENRDCGPATLPNLPLSYGTRHTIAVFLCQSSNLITHTRIQPACPKKEQKQFNVIHDQD